MTYKKTTSFVAAIVAVALSTSPRLADADAPSLDGLLASFAELPGLTVEFREEKRLAMLAVPVVSTGVIRYRPGVLYREVEGGMVARVDGDSLVTRSGDDRQVISLRDNPVVAAFVGSIRDVLTGQRSRLESNYSLSYETSGDAWTLTLTPRNRALSEFLSEMVLSGQGPALSTMVIREQSGDETHTQFSNAQIRSFSDVESRSLFEVAR